MVRSRVYHLWSLVYPAWGLAELSLLNIRMSETLLNYRLWDNIIRSAQICLKQPHPHPTELHPEYNTPNYTLLRNQSLFQQHPS